MKKKEASHLIIGSNSFLGNTLSKKLGIKNSVLGVYHKNTNNLYHKIKHISIENLSNLNNEFDYVYIISAFIPQKKEKNIEKKLEKVNVELVREICTQFKKSKIIYCSSVSVYKESTKEITEFSDLSPNTLYGKSKLKGENIVKMHKKYAIIRISSMYGENMKINTFLPFIINRAINMKKIILFGLGDRKQNYIHVEDVANYLISAATNSLNGVYLATDNLSISNRKVAEYVSSCMVGVTIEYKGLDDSKSFYYNNKYTDKLLQVCVNKKLKEEVIPLIKCLKKQF